MATTLIAPAKPVYPDFGPDLSFAECVKSATALRLGIPNTPTPAIYANMVQVYRHIITPIYARYGKLPVSSFYRSPRLNRAIGGALNSQHMAGEAVDIDCDGSKVSNRELFAWIKAGGIKPDQCIEEFPDEHGNPGWVHISWVSPEKNRGNFLRAIKKNGKTIYVEV